MSQSLLRFTKELKKEDLDTKQTTPLSVGVAISSYIRDINDDNLMSSGHTASSVSGFLEIEPNSALFDQNDEEIMGFETIPGISVSTPISSRIECRTPTSACSKVTLRNGSRKERPTHCHIQLQLEQNTLGEKRVLNISHSPSPNMKSNMRTYDSPLGGEQTCDFGLLQTNTTTPQRLKAQPKTKIRRGLAYSPVSTTNKSQDLNGFSTVTPPQSRRRSVECVTPVSVKSETATPIKRPPQPPTPVRQRSAGGSSIGTVSRSQQKQPLSMTSLRADRMIRAFGSLPVVLYDAENPCTVIKNRSMSGFSERASEFEFQDLLGRGAFGEVWKVRRKVDGKVFALKKMTKDVTLRSINNLIHLLKQLQAPVDGYADYPTQLGATSGREASMFHEKSKEYGTKKTTGIHTVPESEVSILTLSNSSFDIEEAQDIVRECDVDLMRRTTHNEGSAFGTRSRRSFPSLIEGDLEDLCNQGARPLNNSHTEEVLGFSQATNRNISNTVIDTLTCPYNEDIHSQIQTNMSEASLLNSSQDISQISSDYDPVLEAIYTLRETKLALESPTSSSVDTSFNISISYPKARGTDLNYAFFYHPNVLRHWAVWLDCDGVLFVQTDLCEGTVTNLSALLAEQGSLTESLIWKTINEASEGLAHLHRHSFVHRDIKPANLFFIRRSHLEQEGNNSEISSSRWVCWPVVYSRWWLSLQAGLESSLASLSFSEHSEEIEPSRPYPHEVLSEKGQDLVVSFQQIKDPSISLPAVSLHDFYLSGAATQGESVNLSQISQITSSQITCTINQDEQSQASSTDRASNSMDIKLEYEGENCIHETPQANRRKSSQNIHKVHANNALEGSACQTSYFDDPVFDRRNSAPSVYDDQFLRSKKTRTVVPAPSSVSISQDVQRLSEYIIVLGDLGSAVAFKDGVAYGGSEDVDGFFMAPEALNKQCVPAELFKRVLRKDYTDTIELCWRDIRSALVAESWAHTASKESVTNISDAQLAIDESASSRTFESVLSAAQRFQCLPRIGNEVDKLAIKATAAKLVQIVSNQPSLMSNSEDDSEASFNSTPSKTSKLVSRLANEIKSFLHERSSKINSLGKTGSVSHCGISSLFGDEDEDCDLMHAKSLFDFAPGRCMQIDEAPTSMLDSDNLYSNGVNSKVIDSSDMTVKSLGQGPWSDVFSLGVSALSLLTGREPSLIARHVRFLQRTDRDWIAEPLMIPTTVLQDEHEPHFEPSFAASIAPFLPYILACPKFEQLEQLEEAQMNLEKMRSDLARNSKHRQRRGSVTIDKRKGTPRTSSLCASAVKTTPIHAKESDMPSPSNQKLSSKRTDAQETAAPIPRPQMPATYLTIALPTPSGSAIGATPRELVNAKTTFFASSSAAPESCLRPVPSPVFSFTNVPFVPTPIRLRSQTYGGGTSTIASSSAQLTPQSTARVYSYACPPGSNTPLRVTDAKQLANTVRGAVKIGGVTTQSSTPDIWNKSTFKTLPSRSIGSNGIQCRPDSFDIIETTHNLPCTIQPTTRTRSHTLPLSAHVTGRPCESSPLNHKESGLEVRKSLISVFAGEEVQNNQVGDHLSTTTPTRIRNPPVVSDNLCVPNAFRSLNIEITQLSPKEEFHNDNEFQSHPPSNGRVFKASQSLADMLQIMLEPHLALRPSAPALALACRSLVCTEPTKEWIQLATKKVSSKSSHLSTMPSPYKQTTTYETPKLSSMARPLQSCGTPLRKSPHHKIQDFISSNSYYLSSSIGSRGLTSSPVSDLRPRVATPTHLSAGCSSPIPRKSN